jgi:hypothetical protein
MRSFAAACLMLACVGVAAAPFRAEIAWEISRNGTTLAEAVDVLEHDGKTYTVTSTWKGRGLLSLLGDARMASRGSIVAGVLRPTEFEDVRTGRNPAHARFDWGANILTQQYKGPERSAPIPDHPYDRLTQIYGFAFRMPGGEPMQMNVTDGRGVSNYVFQVAGRETLKTPAGEFETLKLVKRKDNPGDRATEIWLALKHHHLPVRVLVIEKDGTRTDQVATRVSAQ